MKGPAPSCSMGTEPVILVGGLLAWALIVGGLALAVWSWSR